MNGLSARTPAPFHAEIRAFLSEKPVEISRNYFLGTFLGGSRIEGVGPVLPRPDVRTITTQSLRPAMNLLARFSPLVFALFVSWFSLGFAPVKADELPKDTNKIERLTVEQARKLAKEFKDTVLYLNGLTALDADTAKALAEFKGGWLYLNGLTTLDADTAKALAEFKGERLSLDSLTTLDAAAANALAEFKGRRLHLNGLTTLDADTAKTLAEFKGKVLSLDGLTTLDADAAKVLTGFQSLDLNGLTTLDAEAAKALAVAQKWNGQLPNLTALDSPDSVAIAQALATRKGRLALPNHKKISPKTLTALIEKEDVEIPLIETLELIQEPDGSGNDDFVIPKWLEEREAERRERDRRGRDRLKSPLRAEPG